MMEDRELESWREQWRDNGGRAQEMPPRLRAIQKRIRRQNLGLILNNLFAAVGAVFVAGFAIFAVRQEPSALRISWAAGIFVMLVVAVGYRVRAQRGTWRAESQSTRAFVELWQRRVLAKLRMIRVGLYLIPCWVVFCTLLFGISWPRFGPDIHAHPRDWQLALGAILVMVSGVSWFLAWYRRRKLRELDEVESLLQQLKG
jgi:O-antigen/teichoic acid export membrane protein